MNGFSAEAAHNTVDIHHRVERGDYDPAGEPGDEVLFCLCNGKMGVRGSIELASPARQPAVYVAGLYDKPDRPEPKSAYGLTLLDKAVTPAYAIAPVWDLIELDIDGRRVDLCTCRARQCRRVLDMHRGLLLAEYVLVDQAERATAVRTVRLVSRTKLDQAWMHAEVEALNHEGRARIAFCAVQPNRPERIPRLRDYICPTELVAVTQAADGGGLLHSRVRETGVEIALACLTTSDEIAGVTERTETGFREVFVTNLKHGEPIRFTRRASLSTSLEADAIMEASHAALGELRAETFEAALAEHTEAWAQAWDDAEVDFAGDEDACQGLRWCTFNLLQLGHATNDRVSISATGLHGQGYFGHVFWDTEVYMLPFYCATQPAVARNLLLYRYHNLNAARANAADWGFAGARFPWTSTWQGYDVTPPDWHSKKEVHVSGAVALAFQQYLDWTGDEAFFRRYGIEVIVSTAVFWQSRVTLGDDGRYHLEDIVGPDEYNDNAHDNYYTMHLAGWNMRRAVEAMDALRSADEERFAAVAATAGYDKAMRDRLLDVSANLALPRTREGVCEQHRGYFDLPDAPITQRGAYNMPLVESYGYDKGAQRGKQADVVMMHFLFPDDFSEPTQRASYEYYDQRCTQGSSLSPAIYAIQGLRLGMNQHAYGYFQLSALLDVKNLHLDKNLHEGIHAACAGGTWMAAVFGYGGVQVTSAGLRIAPRLPEAWESMRFTIAYMGRRLSVLAKRDGATVTLTGEPLELLWKDNPCTLAPGTNQLP